MPATTEQPRLLLTTKEAADALGICEAFLWRHTAPRGLQIPSVKIGRCVRYSPDELRAFFARKGKPDA